MKVDLRCYNVHCIGGWILERRPGVLRWRACPSCSRVARVVKAISHGWLTRILKELGVEA